MNFKGKKILILEGYARQNLEYMRAFRKLGCEVNILCNSKGDICSHSRFADRVIYGVCDPEKPAESAECIVSLIKNGSFDVVLPPVDFSAGILAENYDELSKYARLAVVKKDVFDRTQDKLSVMKLCTENGIPCPKTYFDPANDDIAFPVAVKPRRSYGGIGFHIFRSREELDEFMMTEDISLYVVQEYVEQTNRNRSVCLFIDNDGNVKSSFGYISRRWFPLPAGSGTFNELDTREDVIKTCIKLAKVTGVTGTIGFDLIEETDTGVAKVIEINPRPIACVKVGFEAGIDLALQLLEKEYGENVTEMKVTREKLRIRNSVNDIAWFFISKERFSARPSYFDRRYTKEQIFRIDDPIPWFSYLFQGIKYLVKK